MSLKLVNFLVLILGLSVFADESANVIDCGECKIATNSTFYKDELSVILLLLLLLLFLI